MNERLEKIIASLPFTLTKKQLMAIVCYINGNGHFYLSGEAGSGKSVIINVLKQYYGDAMILGAATGVANQQLCGGLGGDGTAHHIFSIPYYLGQALDKVSSGCANLFSGSDLVRHVVIDEFPMLNSEGLYVILKRLNRYNKRGPNRGTRQIRILGVGDVLQIPPVVKEDTGDLKYLTDRYGSPKLYRSYLWKEFNPTIMVLDEVMRQKDRVFRAALDVLRYGQTERYKGLLAWLNKRVDRNYDASMFTVAAYNVTVDMVNASVLDASVETKVTYDAKFSKKYNWNDSDVPMSITLCKGLKCITTVNDKDGQYFNGSFCTVESCEEDGVWITMNGTGESIFLKMHEYEQTETYVEKDVVLKDGTRGDRLARRPLGTCLQLPIMQSAAFSVHRAQGRTFDEKGILDLGSKGFAYNPSNFGTALLYVGLSRWTRIEDITLPRPLHIGHIKVDRDAIAFWYECLEKSVI